MVLHVLLSFYQYFWYPYSYYKKIPVSHACFHHLRFLKLALQNEDMLLHSNLQDHHWLLQEYFKFWKVFQFHLCTYMLVLFCLEDHQLLIHSIDQKVQKSLLLHLLFQHLQKILKIHTWFFNLVVRNNSRLYIFTQFTHCSNIFVCYFCNNWYFCFALYNNLCINFSIII